MIRPSDSLQNGIYISKRALYDTRVNEHTRRYGEVFKEVDEIIRAHHILKISPDIKLRIGLIRYKREKFLGVFDHETNLLEVDPRVSEDTFISILCHEYIHAEQNFQQRVVCRRGMLFWGGPITVLTERQKKVMARSGAGEDDYQCPWEWEAYLRAPEVFRQIFSYLK